jgi:hypothetical protein
MFTLKSVGTLAGASTGLYLVLGTISSAFGWAYPRWFPLLTAFVLILLFDFVSSAKWRKPALRDVLGRLLVIVLNSCLVFTSSMGGATALSSGEEKPGQPADHPGTPGPGEGSRRPPQPLAPKPDDSPEAVRGARAAGRPAVHRPAANLKTGFSRFSEAFRSAPAREK